MRRSSQTRLPAPYLRRIWLDREAVPDAEAYPWCLPFLREEFELSFDRSITIIVGENGTGKSTLLEGIAVLAGYDEAGGGKGYRPVDHAEAVEAMGGALARSLKASWLPKVTDGWFFRAESFFSVARYLDKAALDAGQRGPDFLSHSHGEGFLRFFEERCQRRGIFIFDEPESALSPARQIEFLKLLRRMDRLGQCQVIMATHAPILMAYPGARLLALSKYGLDPVTIEQTQHFRLIREFCLDPATFVETMMEE
ncbi:AAA family ATPase [Bosea sp. NPDC003192]|uniref:AAA family ATPase n=1 Tax=Bosea sp. NPDC003192 TaxID=3390551 RepID=UPI003D07A5C5